jgi:RHS repeat-associated protein
MGGRSRAAFRPSRAVVFRHSRASGNPLRFAFLFALTLLAAQAASAQVATGFPPFSSLSGGSFETINNANLNVHLSIPVLSKPGRGMPYSYALNYDGSVWTPVSPSGGYVWNPAGGWTTQSQAETGSYNYLAAQVCCPGQGQKCIQGTGTYYNLYTQWKYYDRSRTEHDLPASVAVNDSSISCPLHTGSWSATSASTDGLYTMTVDATPEATAYDIHGHTFNVRTGTVTDSNGNEISGTIDTLGIDALSISVTGSLTNPPIATTYAYYNAASQNESVVTKMEPYTVQTNFGCSGVTEYGPTTLGLVSEIDLPDGTSYSFTYEVTPGDTHNPHYVTGRLAKVILPTGGYITYSYSGGSNGITCSDGSTATLTRTLYDNEGKSLTWTYAHSERGSIWTTNLTAPADPQGNQAYTTISFLGIYETERKVYSTNGGTLLETVDTCYNGAAIPCTGTAVSLPISNRTVQVTLPGLAPSKMYTTYNSHELPTETNEYDYGPTLVRETLTSYASLGNYIYDRPSTITVENASGTTISQTSISYDQTTPTQTNGTPQHVAVSGSRGNPTTVSMTGQNMGTLTRTYTYYDTGNVQTATDVNTAPTQYAYGTGSCGNSFPTTITPPAGPAVQLAYDSSCYGGVVTSVNTGNGATTYSYNDPFSRVTSVEDPAGATTNYYYSPTTAEGVLNFATNSTVDVLTTVDGLGRVVFSQRRQSQSSSTFDSVETAYDALGRAYETSPPYSAGAGTAYTGTTWNTSLYDALARPSAVTDAGGGQLAFSYAENDVLRTMNAPSGENPKRAQYQYDGLGRLSSVCEITSASGSGSCSQNTSATGYFTSYTYDALNDLTSVSQSGQTRSYQYDGKGRLTSETNPESGTTTYTYDTDSTCGTYNGDLVKKVDAVGNVTCFAYDQVHRLTATTYPSGSYASVTPAKHFVYEAATVNGVAMSNTAGRLAEAYTCTGTCNSKLTDLGFSYSARGDVTGTYESTPNSQGYYVTTAAYWQNGLLDVLNLQNGAGTVNFIPTLTYSPEGEGRPGTVSAASGQNPLTATSYNVFSEATGVTLGSGDSDAFSYDPNTGRMTQYQFSVNGSPVTGGLTWNQNGTLQQLAITDPFNSSNQQTCSYVYDDLARAASANCGSVWSQTFSFDVFGNLSKSGTISFQPTYNTSTNQVGNVGGFTPIYDANGNLTSDSVHSYTWDADGNPITIDTVGLTFDALDRMVEQNRGGSYTQIVYGANGGKLALMRGQTLGKAFVPLAGGATAVYTWNSSSSVLSYYRHSDWLGSSRLASYAAGGSQPYYDGAYAPYGENYAETGTQDRNFTGQNQDTISSGPYPLYDFLYREYHPTWGRWVSPDPAGVATATPVNPQAWNRYAYAVNNPLVFVDPLGLSLGEGPPPPPCLFYPNCIPGWGPGGPPGPQPCSSLVPVGVLPSPAIDPCNPGGGRHGNGPRPLPLPRPLSAKMIASLLPCGLLDLNSPSTFWDSGFATAEQLDAFFEALPNAPSSWNGLQAGYAFSGAGLNPGLAAGIIGAETSYGNGPPLSQNNINNPFSYNGATNFTSSMSGAVGLIMRLESTTYTLSTPLTALINQANVLNRAYEGDPMDVRINWASNVNSWFQRFAAFTGNCIPGAK